MQLNLAALNGHSSYCESSSAAPEADHKSVILNGL